MSAFDGGPELLAKREDLCGVAAGGNKWRKLRVLLADARAQRATVVLTTGAPQSNHCAMTAVGAAMYGLRVELFLQGPDPGVQRGNLLIDGLADAAIVFLGHCSDSERDQRLAARMDELRAAGEVPYLIPLGGSTPLGAIACASVVDELHAQLDPRPATHLVVAAGSLGTVAGLVLGVAAAGMDCEVHGYSVLWPEEEATRRLDVLLDAARRTFPAARVRPEYRVFGSQLGPGYGIPTPAGSNATRLAARVDGLLLDPTYTAKAMAGLLHGIQDGTYAGTDRVVFVHTGGLAGLFARDRVDELDAGHDRRRRGRG
jgi:1-aminocyclopropane-1-carboxylate deaminase/D-cysteine desulfhydrase-like pyridoxal-dependent ACC family enzyme